MTLFLKQTNDDISTMVVQNSKGKNIGSDNVQSLGKVLMWIFAMIIIMVIMMMLVVMMIAYNGPHTRAVARVGPSYRLTEATNIITPSHFSALLLRILLLLLLSQPSSIKHSMWHRVSPFRPSHLYI